MTMKQRINYFATVALVWFSLLALLFFLLTFPVAAWFMWQTNEKGGAVILASSGIVLALLAVKFATDDLGFD